MFVRLIAVIEIVLGVWIASITGLPYLKIHIGLGFGMAACLFLLAMIAFVRHEVPVAVLGVAFAALLPFVGLKQFPLKFGSALGPIQYAHVVIGLLAIGVAEALHAKIKRAA